MKAHIREAPELVTYLEPNARHGRGYQARMIMGGIETVIDNEPLSLGEITAAVGDALEDINRTSGYSYKVHEVIRITEEGLQANKGWDITTMQVLRDIERGRGELTVPAGEEYRTEIIDGEEEILLSTRGVVLFTYFAWVDDKSPKARENLQRYCEYLAGQGYGGGAAEILAELDAKSKEDGANWVRATFEKYVRDERGMLNFMMGGLL